MTYHHALSRKISTLLLSAVRRQPKLFLAAASYGRKILLLSHNIETLGQM
jgi:hypothetical protein